MSDAAASWNLRLRQPMRCSGGASWGTVVSGTSTTDNTGATGLFSRGSGWGAARNATGSFSWSLANGLRPLAVLVRDIGEAGRNVDVQSIRIFKRLPCALGELPHLLPR